MMTKLLATLALAIALGESASAQVFTGALDGSQESPAVATTGTGAGTATFNPATNLLTVSVTFDDLVGNTTDAHIHCCFNPPAFPSASVALGFSATFPLGVTSGTFNGTYDLLSDSVYTAGFRNGPGGGTAAGARDALLNGMTNGTAYFNVHTGFRPGGEIRGNIAPIPEPSSWVMFTIGAAVLARQVRRKVAASRA